MGFQENRIYDILLIIGTIFLVVNIFILKEKAMLGLAFMALSSLTIKDKKARHFMIKFDSVSIWILNILITGYLIFK